MSGTNANRPGFQKLLYDAGIDKVIVEIPNGVKKFKKEAVYHISPDRKPLFNEIWIKNTSRYFRNTILSSTIINLLTSITEKYQELFFKVNINYDPELFRVKEKRLKEIKTTLYAI